MTVWCPSALPGEDGCCPACGYVPGRLTRRGLVRTHHRRERIATLLDSTDDDSWNAIGLLHNAVLDLTENVAHLGRAAKGRHHLPLDTAVLMLAALTDARTDLARTEATIEAHIVSLWRQQGRGRTMLEVEGAGVVEVRRTTERKAWDHAALTAAVMDAHLTETQGDIPDPYTVVRWVTDAMGSPGYWRVGVLKALGLRAGDYCHEEPGRDVVRLTR